MPLHVVCVSVCYLAQTASKTVEAIDMPFRVWTQWEKETMY